MSQASISLIIVAVMFVLLLTRLFPMCVTALLAAFAMAAFGIIDLKTILAQFGTSNVFCVLGMMIVGGALFETGAAQKLGNALLGKRALSERVFAIWLVVVVTCFSAFLSNTTTVAMFMPIVGGLVANSNGRLTKKDTYMLIGYGATLGGCMTLVGSPTQHLMAQELLTSNGFAEMDFFYGLRGTLVGLLVLVLYILFAWKPICKTFDFPEIEEMPAPQKSADGKKAGSIRMILSALILAGTILMIALKLVSSGAGALIGATAVVATRCIDIETAMRKVNWQIIALLGALFAVAEGFNTSGAGALCVEWLMGLFGESTTPYLLYAVMVAAAVLLTNVMDNIAAQALLGPIAMAIAIRTGIQPATMAFSVLMGCNIAYATPISTPCITMTLSGGYRFKDYLKVGVPLSLLSFLAVILLFPLIYGL